MPKRIDGSSPLTRGTLFTVTGTFLCGRFIPAYAGNSFYGDGDFFMWSVHPRLRGELGMAAKIAAATAGSSPLTRGTHYLLTQHPRRARFIPAYAGNSWFTVPLRMPRGSSPLTRGTRKVGPDELIRLRFIPAYAGNSSLIHSSLMETTVHPRLRGELASCKCVCSHEHGSSPLTRGTQRRSSRGPYRRWFIPAYAGNSWIQCAAQRCSTVHPRLRGELSRYASSS